MTPYITKDPTTDTVLVTLTKAGEPDPIFDFLQRCWSDTGDTDRIGFEAFCRRKFGIRFLTKNNFYTAMEFSAQSYTQLLLTM